jgi:hypothetical protein
MIWCSLITTIALLLLSPVCLLGHTWYIDPAGTGDAVRIGDGLALTVSGDTLLLADATFTGVGNSGLRVIGKSVAIVSESGDPNACVVDCGGSNKFITFGAQDETGGGSLSGVKVMRSTAAVTVEIYGYATLNDCVFEDNGGCIHVKGLPGEDFGSISIKGCEFISNSGFAIISGYKCTSSIADCLFYGGEALMYGDFLSWNTIRRCTIVGNTPDDGELIQTYWGGFLIQRTIIALNDGIVQAEDPSDLPTIVCCDVWGNTGGDYVGQIAGRNGVSGNISADPQFCNIPGGNFQVEDCSPCLPGNHPDSYDCGGAIGLCGSGCECGTATIPTTWGTVKGLYK